MKEPEAGVFAESVGPCRAFPSSFLRGPSPHLWKEAEAPQAAHDAVNFGETLPFAARLFGVKHKEITSVTDLGEGRNPDVFVPIVPDVSMYQTFGHPGRWVVINTPFYKWEALLIMRYIYVLSPRRNQIKGVLHTVGAQYGLGNHKVRLNLFPQITGVPLRLRLYVYYNDNSEGEIISENPF